MEWLLIPAICGAIGVAGVVVILQGKSEYARAARVKATRTSRITDVRGGFTEVTGRCADGQTMVSPFYQVPCVLVRWSIEEYRAGGKRRSGRWRTVRSGIDGAEFRLEDGSGSARVRVNRRTALYLADRNVTRSGMGSDAPAHVEAFLRRQGTSSTGWVFNKSMRYNEEVIRPGDDIYVLGQAQLDGQGVVFAGTNADELIVANQSQEELIRRMESAGSTRMIAGTAMLVMAVGLGLVLTLLR